MSAVARPGFAWWSSASAQERLANLQKAFVAAADEAVRLGVVAEIFDLFESVEALVVGEGSDQYQTLRAYYDAIEFLRHEQVRSYVTRLAAANVERLFALETDERMSDAARRAKEPELYLKAAIVVADRLRDRNDVAAATARLERASAEGSLSTLVFPMLLVKRAELCWHAGAYDEALALLVEAEERVAAVEPLVRNDAVKARFLRQTECLRVGVRGQVFLSQGKPDRAGRDVRDALEAAAALRDGTVYFGAVVRQINYDLAVENAEGALARADAALASVGESRESTRAQLLVRRGQAFTELSRDDRSVLFAARDALREALASPAITASESTRAALALVDVEIRAGELEAAAARLAAIDRGTAAGLHATGQGLRLQLLRASLAAALALARGDDRDRLARSREELQAVYDDWLDEARAGPRDEDGKSFLFFGAPRRLLSELIRITIALDGEGAGVVRAFELLLRAQELGTVTFARGGRVGSVTNARERLADGEGILVFLPAPDRSHLFVLDARSLTHHEIAADMRIFEARKEFIGLVARRPPLDATLRERRDLGLASAGARLRDLLLPRDVRRTVRSWTKLTIVGIDLLGTIPFEALPDEDGRALGLGIALRYLPSIPLDHRLTAAVGRAGATDFDVFLFAAPRHSEEVATRWPRLEPLEFGREQRWRLTRAYDLDRIAEAIGPEATGGVLSRDAGRADVVQIWTHGLYLDELTRPAALVVGVDELFPRGILTCSDAERLGVGRLVVLSACGAARGPVRRGGDGVSNLGGAFLVGGASTVVLPSCDVDEAATLALMERFHVHLRDGGPPSAALAAARRALARDPRFDDPYYYALVHVVGAGHDAVFLPARGRGPRTLIVAAMLLVAAAAAAARANRRRAGG